jgi:streptogramin lyase
MITTGVTVHRLNSTTEQFNQERKQSQHIDYQIMTEPSLTTLIGDEIQGRYNKWLAFVDGGDGSLTEIGPDLGEGRYKWRCGVRANTGSIYCAPYGADHILKIDPIQGTVETLTDIEMPETGRGLWASGALAPDNHIYYMPAFARQIMRLNPDNDSLSSVGDDLGGGEYSGTVVGNDDCVYGIPDDATCIVKFDPTNPDTTSTVGERINDKCGNGVLCGDGDIYAANQSGQVLKVDTTNGNYTWIGDPNDSHHKGTEWGDPIVGGDKCIYWPPFNANRVLKFDPETQQLPSLVGDDLAAEGEDLAEGECKLKWQSGALATDGVIYCIPCYATHVFAIDPFKELSATLQTNMKLYPNELGCLFLKDEECDETFFESSLRKFGGDKVFELIEECLPLHAEWACAYYNGSLPPFMVAASCENCAASVIYYLLRRNVNVFQ